jgi:two-component system LytT family response regulator
VKIRTLIADDEPLARQRIRSLLDKEPDFETVGECPDGQKAVVALQEQQPDLLFLDVQMPVLDGFGVVETVGPERMPVLIFVTAYDRYALRAFEAHALDYLLKPFDRQRFSRTLERARTMIERRQGADASRRLLALLEDRRETRKPLERLVIKSAGRVSFVRVEEIDWIEAAGNYLRLHAGKETHLLRDTMNRLESKLNASQFVRIHRSTIVNLESIRELQPSFHGDYAVVLRNGTELTLSRSYRDKVQEALGNSL